MRARRGNYMMMFMVLLPLLLGFMSLAIDLGRLRVARIQALNAADAAGLSAIATRRGGGSLGVAYANATAAANLVRLSRVRTENYTTTGSWNVTLTWGDYNWNTRTFIPGGAGNSAVDVIATQLEPPVAMLFGKIFESSGFYGAGNAAGSTSESLLTARKTVAMKPRDLVVLLDVSRASRRNFDDSPDDVFAAMKAQITSLITAIGASGAGDDRLAVIAYAGEAAPVPGAESLTRVRDNVGVLTAAVNAAPICSVGIDAWLYWYRHFASAADPELRSAQVIGPSRTYRAIDPVGSRNAQPGFFWPFLSVEGVFFRTSVVRPGRAPYGDDLEWARDLTKEEQCDGWEVSALLFMLEDPRWIDNDVPSGTWIDCHEGSWYETAGIREAAFEPVIAQDCEATSPTAAALTTPPDVSFGTPDGAVLWPDHAYHFAGANPAAGLALARALLAAEGDVREQHVVLFSPRGAACGPLTDPTEIEVCRGDWETAAFVQAGLLGADGVHLHVGGSVAAGSDGDVFLGLLPQNRGLYYRVDDPDLLDEFVTDVARNIRIQVVE